MLTIIRIYVDGEKIVQTDADLNKIEPFISYTTVQHIFRYEPSVRRFAKKSFGMKKQTAYTLAKDFRKNKKHLSKHC